jgi:hypothetical protein
VGTQQRDPASDTWHHHLVSETLHLSQCGPIALGNPDQATPSILSLSTSSYSHKELTTLTYSHTLLQRTEISQRLIPKERTPEQRTPEAPRTCWAFGSLFGLFF